MNNVFQMLSNPQKYAMDMLSKNPSLANNTIVQSLISQLQNGNSKEAENIARNYLKTNGVDPDSFMNNFLGNKR